MTRRGASGGPDDVAQQRLPVPIGHARRSWQAPRAAQPHRLGKRVNVGDTARVRQEFGAVARVATQKLDSTIGDDRRQAVTVVLGLMRLAARLPNATTCNRMRSVGQDRPRGKRESRHGQDTGVRLLGGSSRARFGKAAAPFRARCGRAIDVLIDFIAPSGVTRPAHTAVAVSTRSSRN